jgi:hypothetical protein
VHDPDQLVERPELALGQLGQQRRAVAAVGGPQGGGQAATADLVAAAGVAEQPPQPSTRAACRGPTASVIAPVPAATTTPGVSPTAPQ